MITEDRLKHILGVARRCEELAMEHYDIKDRSHERIVLDKFFLLGWLHDVGYEWGDNPFHAGLSERVAANGSVDRAICTAIRYHGKPIDQSSLNLTERLYLDILNRADLETMPDGSRCTTQERLADIAQRCGKDSRQYMTMEMLAKELNLI